MKKKSAGILLFRRASKELEFLLIHPGGPFWRNKEDGAWSIPKGEIGDEPPLAAARREFKEETGKALRGRAIPLTPIRQKSGKEVMAWAVEGDADPDQLVSNTFEMEWPPRSGKKITVPEADRFGWFNFTTAQKKINPAQVSLLRELISILTPVPGES